MSSDFSEIRDILNASRRHKVTSREWRYNSFKSLLNKYHIPYKEATQLCLLVGGKLYIKTSEPEIRLKGRRSLYQKVSWNSILVVLFCMFQIKFEEEDILQFYKYVPKHMIDREVYCEE